MEITNLISLCILEEENENRKSGKKRKKRDTKIESIGYRVRKHYNLFVTWLSEECPNSGPSFWRSGYRRGLFRMFVHRLNLRC